MNYQRTKPVSKKTTKIAIAVIAILVLLRLIVPHTFAGFFSVIFSPLWRLENAIVRTISPEHQIIFASDSAFSSSTVAELLQENNDLKDLLGRPNTQNAIVSVVLSKPPFSAYDTLIVDAGSNQGVTAGDEVYALANPVVYSTSADVPPSASTTISFSATSSVSSSKNIHAHTVASVTVISNISSSTSSTTNNINNPLDPQIEIPVGQVAVTFGNTSVVTLFSSPGQTYQVSIGLYHISATATAQGSGMFEAMVPNNSNIVVGDPVMVPSIQSGVFASVVSVVSDPARPYSSVFFQSPVDPFLLYFVEINKAGVANVKVK